MALTLTDILPPVYKGVQEVTRESVGFINGGMVNRSEESAAHNSPVSSIFAGKATSSDVTGGMNFPTATATTGTKRTLTMSGYKASQVEVRGEQMKLIGQGSGFSKYMQDAVSEAVRTLALEVESTARDAVQNDVLFGANLVTPFASDLDAAAEIRERLQIMGASEMDRSLVLDYGTAANLLKQSDYRADSERTDDGMLRSGQLGRVFGLQPYESSRRISVASTNPGNSAQTAAAGDVGATSIAIDGASNNLNLNGAFVRFGADNSGFIYKVSTARAAGGRQQALSGSSGFLNIPGGLRTAIADNTAIDAVGNATGVIVAFPMRALEIACRMPETGDDSARSAEPVTDPVSGLTFRVAMYGGYHNFMIDISCVFGAKLWNAEHALFIRNVAS